MNSINNFLTKYQTPLYIFFIISISFYCILLYVSNGQNLLYGDALSRLNISRKVVDNLTPGLAQLGNVWLPFPQILMLSLIWNSSLWHSGIAGTVISALAFIIGGIYIFKSINLLLKNVGASFFGLSIYLLNINLLYLQTTAMSEAIFLSTLAVSTYYFLLWTKTNEKMYLLPAAIGICAMTLTRYEGLAMLFASIPMVFFTALAINRKFSNAEGQTILYSLLALTGFGAWTIYLTVIFGDPLYWVHYYAAPQVVEATSVVKTYARHVNFFQAIWIYFTSMVWMIGLFPILFSIIGLIIVIIKSIKEKSVRYVPLFLPLSIFAFMILTLQRNTPIDQPELTIKNILAAGTSNYQEFNIRYGLILLPLIAILSAYVFNVKNFLIKIILIIFFSIQLISYIKPTYSVIYQIPLNVTRNTTQGTPKEKAMVKWMKAHYDHGLIMISALKHDPQMLQLGYDYKTYIHEGSGMYWKDTIKYPERYATWVIFDSYNKDDQVTKYLNNSPYLPEFYNLVYDKDGMKIYRIKTKPELIN